MILTLSHGEDAHALRVHSELEAMGREHLLFDLAALPLHTSATFEYRDPKEPELALQFADGRRVDLGAVTAAWWRRPRVPDVSCVAGESMQVFVANEWNEALYGLWQLLDCRWMNSPAADERASRKAYQLRCAARHGLRTPRTRITSAPDQARAFIAELGIGRTVYKTFSCTHSVWRETRLLREQDLAQLESVQFSPVIFQEYVRAEADLRITIVGDRVFPAAIRFRADDEPVDFRLNLGRAQVDPTALPPSVEQRLLALMSELGLYYGAVDMRRTPEGEHVFLEVNTAGEFLFIEERTGQPIARTLAEWLAGELVVLSDEPYWDAQRLLVRTNAM